MVKDLYGTTEGYGTHRRLLKWAIDHSTGPILELGTGQYSTPIISNAVSSGRTAVSYEDDREWLAINKEQYGCQNHWFGSPPPVPGYPSWPDWNLIPYRNHQWGVVLIDNRPSSARVLALIAVAHHAEFVVVHDTEQPLYYYDNALTLYRHVYTDQTVVPHTTIASNTREIRID